ncbi:hypothetical protein MtrunA17_Chr6g0456941 [Medicago truncatula]|uniref:Transmembrane protein n=1 Tax=Medicago truncatula TaxID=3880 RepID=A0A396HAZ7_MEDTR|nr:hypothetical protein MtrunA17_Chr6g0456941 [Medicago truncatula]
MMMQSLLLMLIMACSLLVAHELPRLLESIPTIADTDMLYNVTISGDGNYVPQPNANNLEIDMTMGKPEEFSNYFPDILSCIDFSDFFSECQSQMLDILAHDINNKRRKTESGCDVSIQHKDVIIIDDDDDADEEDIQDITVFSQEGADDLERHAMTDKTNQEVPMEIDIEANDNMHACIREVPIPIDIEHKQDGIEFNQEGTDADQVNDAVSSIDMFIHDQITEHITSLKKPNED